MCWPFRAPSLILFCFVFPFSPNMLRILQNQKLIQPLISTRHAFQKRTLASTSNDLENAYDVVIIGGGVAGVTLACSLGK